MRKITTWMKRRTGLARAVVAMALVVTLGASLWLAAPAAVEAVVVSSTVSNSPISNTTTHLLGETVSIPSYIEFNPGEQIPVELVQLQLTGAEFPVPFTQILPLQPGSYTYPGNATKNLTGPGVLDVTVTWDPGIISGGSFGYGGYGYGYGYFRNDSNQKAKIKYDIKWKPPILLTIPPSPPPSLPGSAQAFTIDITAVPELYYVAPTGLAYLSSTNQLAILMDNYTELGEQGMVLVTDLAGNHVRHFNVPLPGRAAGITSFQGKVWVSVYDYNTGENHLLGLNAANGNLVNDYPVAYGMAGGGLTNDGTNLWIGYEGTGLLNKIDPADGSVLNAFYTYDPTGMNNIWSVNGLDYYGNAPNGTLLVGQDNRVVRVDPANGQIMGADTDNSWLINNIQGLTMVGNTIYDVQGDGTVRKAYLPIAPAPEQTTAGDYTSRFSVETSSDSYAQTGSFTLSKVDEVIVTITEPTPNFFSSTADILIKGSVNAPDISQVSVGVSLPETTLIKQTFESGLNDEVTGQPWTFQTRPEPQPQGYWADIADGLWHSTTKKAYAGTKSAWYGKENTGDYDTIGYPYPTAWWTESMRNRGSLTSPSFKVGAGTKLSFQTWWQTDFGIWDDQKLVQVSINNGPWQNFLNVVELAAADGYQYAREQPDMPEFQYVEVPPVPYSPPGSPQPPLPGENGWSYVERELPQSLVGQNIRVRFLFDTRNPWGNFFGGWYVDNIEATGAGFKGVTVPTTGYDPLFETIFTLAEGLSEITVKATSTYPPYLEGEKVISGVLDTTSPDSSINPLAGFTKVSTLTVSGTWGDANPKMLTVTQNDAVVFTSLSAGQWSRNLTVVEGNNVIKATAEDKAGWKTTATASIILDTTPPTLVVLPTKYKDGEVSARPGDEASLQVNATDNQTGIDRVEVYPPGAPNPFLMMPSVWDPVNHEGLPDAFLDQLGLTGNYVAPGFSVPSGSAPGTYTMQIKAYDKAGNVTTGQATFKVVSALEAFNFYLMPGWNLMSLPLTPSTSNGDIATFVDGTSGQNAGTQPVTAVWHYDAATANWLVYTPADSSSPVPVNTLTKVETGKGYWVDTNAVAFNYSDPIMEGFASTPVPVKLSYAGKFLEPGKLPPTYNVVAGWNLIGYHAEKVRNTSLYLAGDIASKWVRLIRYDNYFKILFGQEGPPEVILGAYRSVYASQAIAPPGEPYEMEPGQGFWIYMQSASNIVPLP